MKRSDHGGAEQRFANGWAHGRRVVAIAACLSLANGRALALRPKNS
jgi:hypothetical protein